MFKPGDYIMYTDDQIRKIREAYTKVHIKILKNDEELYRNLKNRMFIVTSINGNYLAAISNKTVHESMLVTRFKKATPGQIRRYQLENIFTQKWNKKEKVNSVIFEIGDYVVYEDEEIKNIQASYSLIMGDKNEKLTQSLKNKVFVITNDSDEQYVDAVSDNKLYRSIRNTAIKKASVAQIKQYQLKNLFTSK